VLLLILLVAAPWAALIPMASLAGVLMIVAYNMSEWHVFVKLLRGPRSDVLVLVSTFVLTVAVDLTVAIQFGVVLAALLFMRRMADVSQITSIRDVLREDEEREESWPPELPPRVEVFEINGSFCFGAARKFTETLLAIRSTPDVVVLRMRHVLAMDATGMHAIEDVAARLKKRGVSLLLSGVQAQPLLALERSGTIDRIGRENVFRDFNAALAATHKFVDPVVDPPREDLTSV
ncbi:MAG: STAS domain-containing protein, partial [Verrucomicrobia bacterium]|nr:STAS domain-containing protein [Verrucomicrobiota bacterium]